MEDQSTNKVFAIKFDIKPNNIQTQIQNQNVSPHEALGLLEMAKQQILDNLKKSTKEIFKSVKK